MTIRWMRTACEKTALGILVGGLLSACGTDTATPLGTGAAATTDAVTAAARTQKEFQDYWAKQRQMKENGEVAQPTVKSKPAPEPKVVASPQPPSEDERRQTVSQWWAEKKAKKAQAEPVAKEQPASTAPPVAAAAPEPKEKKSGGRSRGKKDKATAAVDVSGIDLSGDFPTAVPVENSPGLVRSPYNERFVNVKGVASGMLVADPRFELSERKFFIVP